MGRRVKILRELIKYSRLSEWEVFGVKTRMLFSVNLGMGCCCVNVGWGEIIPALQTSMGKSEMLLKSRITSVLTLTICLFRFGKPLHNARTVHLIHFPPNDNAQNSAIKLKNFMKNGYLYSRKLWRWIVSSGRFVEDKSPDISSQLKIRTNWRRNGLCFLHKLENQILYTYTSKGSMFESLR